MMADNKEEKRILGLTKKQRSHVYTTIFVIVFLIFFFVNNDFSDQAEGPYPPNYKSKIDPDSRDKAPHFEHPNVDGDIVSINDFRGEVILLNFWTSWSEPCRNFLPDLIELKNEFSNKEFEIIGISLDTETKENVPNVVNSAGINYPVLYGTLTTAKSFGDIRSIPTTFILDREGRIYTSYVGEIKKEVLKNDINKLLGE